MNELSTEIMAALAKKEDVGEIIRQAVEQAVNGLLKNELTVFLGYQAYQRPDQTNNYRNGSYERQLTTKYGDITCRSLGTAPENLNNKRLIVINDELIV